MDSALHRDFHLDGSLLPASTHSRNRLQFHRIHNDGPETISQNKTKTVHFLRGALMIAVAAADGSRVLDRLLHVTLWENAIGTLMLHDNACHLLSIRPPVTLMDACQTEKSNNAVVNLIDSETLNRLLLSVPPDT
jgi:hypothetical protein